MNSTIVQSNKMYAMATLAIAVAMAGVVGGAWIFELNGYVPCKLCLAQRVPYYIGSPLLVVGAMLALASSPIIFTRIALFLGAALMIYGGALGFYHSGVEWSLWGGPTNCGATDGNLSTNSTDLFGSLDTIKPPACDTAAGRFLGLSFAGWNVVASLILTAACLWLATRRMNSKEV